MSDLEQSASFWDREHATREVRSWMEHPTVREAINRRIGGGRSMWPLDWLAERAPRTFDRALSLGCGTGAFERDLVRRGIARRVDALDISTASVATANETARGEELGDSINYFVADFNKLRLRPATYDLVLFHQSLHHVDQLERLLSTIMIALRKDGLLYLDEYVGPSRTWWTPRRFSSIRFVYDRLPAPVRTAPKLPIPIMAEDPSEAVRSGEILSRLGIGYQTIANRGYGGNLLAPIFPYLSPQTDREIIAKLVEQEEALVSDAEPSHYQLLLTRPRHGFAAARARLIYHVLAIAHDLGLAAATVRVRRLTRRVWVAVDRRVRRKPVEDYT